jgi:hypothetical protein
MPSTSAKQRRFMAAAAHDPGFAKEAGIKQSVAQDFYAADQAKRPSRRERIKAAMANVAARARAKQQGLT